MDQHRLAEEAVKHRQPRAGGLADAEQQRREAAECHHQAGERVEQDCAFDLHAAPQPIWSTILPKWRLARIIASASPMSSSLNVLSIGSASLPASMAGHRSARIRRLISRISSMVRVRKVTPI